jgi:peptidoglycan DL-endopeptidase CwlO
MKARARQVLAQVDALDRQVEQVAEAYDLAGVDLARTRKSLRVNARALHVARNNLAHAQTDLARLLVTRYEQGETNSTLTVLIGATSLSDVIDRLDAEQRIADQDESVLEQVLRFRARVLTERRQLRREQKAKQALRATLHRRRAQIEGRLVERRRLLASISDEVARVQAQERVRQERLRRSAEARLATQPLPAAVPAQPVAVTKGAPAAGGPADPSSGGHPEVVAIAMRYLGVPYQWGGASPSGGFDCSGLVMYVYAQVGVALPHNAALQYGYGAPVDRNSLRPGDLVFFNGLGHDGIYIGGGQFIDAPKTGDVVKIENLNDAWWAASYVGARRLP